MNPLLLPPAIAHLLAWAAFLGVVFWPYGYSVTTTSELPGGIVRTVFGHSPGPFRRYLGPEEVLLLLMPVALTGLAVWLASRQSAQSERAKLAMWLLAALCLGYCSVPIWFIDEVDLSFIGVFYLPAAVASIVSVIIVSVKTKPAPDVTSESQSPDRGSYIEAQ